MNRLLNFSIGKVCHSYRGDNAMGFTIYNFYFHLVQYFTQTKALHSLHTVRNRRKCVFSSASSIYHFNFCAENFESDLDIMWPFRYGVREGMERHNSDFLNCLCGTLVLHFFGSTHNKNDF